MTKQLLNIYISFVMNRAEVLFLELSARGGGGGGGGTPFVWVVYLPTFYEI